jgi:RIO-like serine/threonine protein kinase
VAIAVNEPTSRTVLKRDLLGTVCRIDAPAQDSRAGFACIERDTRDARWWLRLAARRLAAREARALAALQQVPGIPRLLQWDGRRLQRSWLDGQPMHRNPPRDPAYYRDALRLIRRLHAAGVVHNDLAKEPNWLVAPDGSPAVVDFQLAMRPRYRGWRFRALAYDDLRHLLKHKRRYFPERLTRRQLAILRRRSAISALWARSGKPVYRFVTRRLLGWSDREGAGDRYPA